MRLVMTLAVLLSAFTASAGRAEPTNARALGAERGERLYQTKCIGCHSLDANRVGPKHRGVVGRRAGSVPGYRYSDAVKGSKIVWTADTLDKWLANPEALIPGQRMGYRVRSADQRRDIIAFLNDRSNP